MKKYIISTLVISTFLIYVLYERTMGINTILPTKQSPIDVATGVTTKTNPVVTFFSNEDGSASVSVPIQTQTPKKTSPPPTPTPVSVPVAVKPKGQYTDGQYIGDVTDAYYGNIQVKAIIQNGRISDVVFLDYPQDRNRSVSINNSAMPILRQEAIQIQSANVNTVSGATDSSGAFRQSLDSALAQARN